VEGPVTTLLFDLGGVVFRIDFERALRFWADKAGSDLEQVRRRFHIDEAYERHELGQLDAQRYFEALAVTLGISLEYSDFLAGWNDVYLDAVDGMDLLLEAASRRFGLFAFSNTNESHQLVWSQLFRRELRHFRSVFTSWELGARKPDPEAFREVALLIGRPSSQIWFFDDSEENVAGAQLAGMNASVVRSIDDVRSVLRALGITGN
jgi:glucose-1-phosphatase